MLKNITLSADSEVIRLARQKAAQERTTLNERFRQWVTRYAKTGLQGETYDGVMKKVGYAKPGRAFTREEMNER
jgi:hypothetical protein